MAKILLNISMDLYERVKKYGVHGDYDDELKIHNAFCDDSIVFPDKATNGDIIKALFPKVQDVDIDWVGEDWWNLPYEVTDGN